MSKTIVHRNFLKYIFSSLHLDALSSRLLRSLCLCLKLLTTSFSRMQRLHELMTGCNQIIVYICLYSICRCLILFLCFCVPRKILEAFLCYLFYMFYVKSRQGNIYTLSWILFYLCRDKPSETVSPLVFASTE